jgi:hypothetical protein
MWATHIEFNYERIVNRQGTIPSLIKSIKLCVKAQIIKTSIALY